MSTQEANIYTVRPDKTALWLPQSVMDRLGLVFGDHLTPAQYGCEDIQGLLRRRLAAQGGPKPQEKANL